VVTAIVGGRLRQVLRDLQRQGYGVVLVSLGEREMDGDGLPISLSPHLRHYHIERQIWHELEALELA
jgi:hypothetical protein